MDSDNSSGSEGDQPIPTKKAKLSKDEGKIPMTRSARIRFRFFESRYRPRWLSVVVKANFRLFTALVRSY